MLRSSLEALTASEPTGTNRDAGTGAPGSLGRDADLDELLQRWTVRDEIDARGVPVNRKGYVSCLSPTHDDWEPSLKLYTGGGWKCYGCEVGGTVIDLICLADGKDPKTKEGRQHAIDLIRDRLGVERPVPEVTVLRADPPDWGDVPPADHPPDERAGEARKPAESATERVRTSWWPVDAHPYLDGEADSEPPPTILRRQDGAALLYPATINALYGESESMKSWLAQVATAQTIADGNLAVYVDFESTAGKVYGRLQALGADRDTLLRSFRYIRPTDPLDDRAGRDLDQTLAAKPALIVLDGVTEALELHGLDLASNNDWSKFNRALLRRCAESGAVVVLVDHVTKAREDGRRYAIGAQHKRASVDGAAYTVAAVRPFGRGRHGIARLTVTKDRPGHVRGTLTDEGERVAELHLRSNDDGSDVTAELREPGADGATFRPTTLMERVSVALETTGGGMSVRNVLDAVSGKQSAVRDGLAVLVQEGYVRRESGPRGALLHHSTRPYRAEDDPQKDPSV